MLLRRNSNKLKLKLINSRRPMKLSRLNKLIRMPLSPLRKKPPNKQSSMHTLQPRLNWKKWMLLLQKLGQHLMTQLQNSQKVHQNSSISRELLKLQTKHMKLEGKYLIKLRLPNSHKRLRSKKSKSKRKERLLLPPLKLLLIPSRQHSRKLKMLPH